VEVVEVVVDVVELVVEVTVTAAFVKTIGIGAESS
jgi:hypothetical protein